ncbi:hypothetical protein [Amycolatopsis sp. NPDC003861]
MASKFSSSKASNQDGASFWARQTTKDKVSIIAFSVQLAISLSLLLVGVLIGDGGLNLGGRFALLTGNIVALVAALQFAVSRFFDDQKANIDKLSGELEEIKISINQNLEEVGSIATFGETYVKIFRQQDPIKSQYKMSLDSFLRKLSNCIDDKRSGALDIIDYYGVLEAQAAAIVNDKKECESEKTQYRGEIWALSFLLDDEWDDSSIHEVKWFGTLKRMDGSGIPTRRLWAFDKKMVALLKKEPLEEDGRELIRRLSLYCAENTEFKNTLSYAIPKQAILDEHVRIFGKGFFGAAFTDGSFGLIRGVCFDNLLSSNSLGGEVDFDEARIRQIRQYWERYLTLAKPLKAYLHEVGGDSAKEYMKLSWGTTESN